jgi:hypothetical protein
MALDAGKANLSRGGGASSVVEHPLTAKGLAEARQLIAHGASPVMAFSRVVDHPGASATLTTTTTSDSYSIGGGVEVGLGGVKLGISAKATIGKAHTESEREITAPTMRDVDLMTGAGGPGPDHP